MIRSELVLRVASRHPGLTRAAAEAAVDAMLERIVAALAAGDRVEIRDFGSFATRRRRSRAAFNPKAGEFVVVEERTAVVFKAGRGMRILLVEGPAPDSADERELGEVGGRRGWTNRQAGE
jgi:integration host factor subunit beta